MLREATSICALTEGVPSGATVMVPLKVSNRPRTLLTIRWRTEKSVDECTESIAHVPTLSGVAAVVVVIACPFLSDGAGRSDPLQLRTGLWSGLFRLVSVFFVAHLDASSSRGGGPPSCRT